MLTRVLEAIERNNGAVDLRTLGRELQVEPSALEGMIAFWVRKGRLSDGGGGDGRDGDGGGGDCNDGDCNDGDGREGDGRVGDCSSCGPTCGGGAPCPFVIRAPRVLSVVPGRSPSGEPPDD